MSPEPEPPTDAGYEPDTSWTLHEAVEWHLARIARHETRIRRMDAETDRMVERHREWNERRTAQSRGKVFQSRLVVEQLMLTAIEQDPKAAKSLELPSGTVSTRKGSTVVQVDDFEALKAWSYQNDENVVRWKPEPALDVIKEALTQGEILPGVTLVSKDRTVTIKVEGGGDV